MCEFCVFVHAHVLSALTLCDPMDYSPPGSFVHRIFQARILEWAAISYCKGIFPTQGSNPSYVPALAGRFFFFYQLSHLGSPHNVIICQILLWFCRLILWEVEVKVKWKYKSLSPVLVFATPWTIQSMKFSRPEYQSG